MPRPDDPRESSIAALARDYMRRTKKGIKKRITKVDLEGDTAFQEGKTHFMARSDPAKAALLGLLLPGGGFLYVKRPFAASAALMGLLLTGTLFGSLSGILPSWISIPLLRDLHWNFPLGPSLIVTGLLFSVLWWLSTIWPVWIVRDATPKSYRPTESLWKLLIGSTLPIVGQISQGRFWSGYIWGIFYFWVPLSAASAIKIWKDAAIQPLTDVAKMEPYFIGAVILFSISFFVVLGALWFSITWAFRELGWLGKHRDFGTEWKFVTLGSAVILAVAAYVFVGRPGDHVQQWLWDSSVKIEARGFPTSAHTLRRTVQRWERAALPLKDFLTHVK